MDDNEEADRVFDETPLKQLNISFRLVRGLEKCGCNSLKEAFEIDEGFLEKQLDSRAFGEFVSIYDSYEADPEALAKRLRAEKAKRPDSAIRSVAERKPSFPDGAKRHPTARRPRNSREHAFVRVPATPYTERLFRYEERAKAALDALDDHRSEAIVAECFPKFVGEFEPIRQDLRSLVEYCGKQGVSPFAMIGSRFRNVFLVYACEATQRNYDKNALWPYLMDELGIDGKNQGAQVDYKTLVEEIIDERGFPRYSEDEASFYYMYTMLLHGGLSEVVWTCLWRDTIIPIVRENEAGGGYGGVLPNGFDLLKKAREEDGRFAIKSEGARRVLMKAPETLMAPMLEAALTTAFRAESVKSTKNTFAVLSNQGLTDTAMRSLMASFEEGPSTCKSAQAQSSSRSSKKRRMVYLSPASLRLNLEREKVYLQWDKQAFPKSFIDFTVEYSVNGQIVYEQPFAMGVGSCVLERVAIEVAPKPSYWVEVRIVESVAETKTVRGAVAQSFVHGKPGVFEFVQEPDGEYCLRRRGSRILKKRRIAYLAKEGRKVVPGSGMTNVAYYEGNDAWEGASIAVFDVEPGSCGSVEDAFGRSIAVWQEDYQAKIDGGSRLGINGRGEPLFGYRDSRNHANAALPEIEIRVFDERAALEDVQIECVCDGSSVSVPRKVPYGSVMCGSGESRSLYVKLQDASLPAFVREGKLTIRQRSTGRSIFQFGFSIIPISSFRLGSVSRAALGLEGTYIFQTVKEVVVSRDADRKDVLPWCEYSFSAPLKDERAVFSFDDERQEPLEAVFDLAAIDIRIPRRIVKTEAERPLCLVDSIAAIRSEKHVDVSMKGKRRGRRMLAQLGCAPLFFETAEDPIERTIPLLDSPGALMPDQGSGRCSFDVCIWFGERLEDDIAMPAWCDVSLLEFEKGVGLGTVTAKLDACEASFEKHAVADLRYRFADKKGAALLGRDVFRTMPKGASMLELPEAIVDELRRGRTVLLQVTASPPLRPPDFSICQSYDLKAAVCKHE